MGFFDRFPYTNFHEINLDWIIGKIRHIDEAVADSASSAAAAKQSEDNASASERQAGDYASAAHAAELHASDSADAAADSADDADQSKTRAEELAGIIQDEIGVVTQRIDNIIVQGTPTEGNAELIDIRVSADGRTFTTAGDAVRGQVSDLQDNISEFTSAVNENLGNTIVSTKLHSYIATNNNTGTTTSLTEYYDRSVDTGCAVFPCAADDTFFIKGSGGQGARLWAFLDANNIMLLKADPNETTSGKIIKAPANAAKLVLNVNGYCISRKLIYEELDACTRKSNYEYNCISEMERNRIYTSADFTPILGSEVVECTNDYVKLYNDPPTTPSNCMGVISRRNYLNFRSLGLFIIAFKTTDWAPDGVALVVNPNNGYLYMCVMGEPTMRTHSGNLTVGTNEHEKIKAYQRNGRLYLNLGGYTNVLDMSTYPVHPAAPVYGNWTADDIVFGILSTTDDSSSTAREIAYAQDRALTRNNVYYALGDSLTSGSYSDPDGTPHAVSNTLWSYPQRIADMAGCEVHNLAIPGGSSSSIYVNEVPNVNTDATLITVMTGTNDYSLGSALGTYESTDWNTHMGRVYEIITSLITRCPGARIVLLTPPTSAGDLTHADVATNYRRGTPCAAGWTYDDLANEYEKFCKKYGIEFINCMWNSPINTFNLWDMLPDATHPTKEAYKPLAQYIYSQLF